MTEKLSTEARLALSLQTNGLAERAAPFVDARVLHANHLQLADTLAAASGETNPDHALIAALALSAQDRGHSALSLRADLLPRMVPAHPDDPNEADAITASLRWPNMGNFANSPLPKTTPPLLNANDDTHMGPMVQTQRLACEESWLAAGLLDIAQSSPDKDTHFLRLRNEHVALAKALFQPKPKAGKDDQSQPAKGDHPAIVIFETLKDNRLAIITGGPGTGKTWSIKRLLAVFHVAAAQRNAQQPFTVALAAPTGKAGVRMREAIREELEDLEAALQDAAQALGLDVDAKAIGEKLKAHDSSTLHRLLGLRPDGGSARHNAQNPLPYDVVIVDEASMADLAMMRRLVQAIGPSTRLILLGDPDQLPSVDVGAVLADLVAPQNGPLPVIRFTENKRSKEAKTLALLVKALQTPGQDAQDQAMAILRGETTSPKETIASRIVHRKPPRPPQGGDDSLYDGTYKDLIADLVKPWKEDKLEVKVDGKLVVEDVKGYLTRFAELLTTKPHWRRAVQDNAEALFDSFDKYRILAVHRKGSLGVGGLSYAIEKKIRDALTAAWKAGGPTGKRDHPLPTYAGKWLGQAILITQNDPNLNVYNGDIGIVLPYPTGSEAHGSSDNSAQSHSNRLALALPREHNPNDPGPQERLRYLSLHQLPEHESAFVMTVHKSQGSQFAHTAVVLADRPSAIQTRELVYTGITRAQQKVTWVGTEASMRAALETRVLRGSLLEQRITDHAATTIPQRSSAQGESEPE